MSETREALRESRERDLVAATRRLFDERGFRDAPVEEIAKQVGIARGLIYRQFSSKDELYVLTVTDYLAELAGKLDAASRGAADPAQRLERIATAFAAFCERYPAFLDSSMALMHDPAERLQASVSESVWVRLGSGMADCIDQVAAVLRSGAEAGVFEVADPDYAANLLWTQTLGAMHLARIGVGVKRVDGEPALFRVAADDVVASCVTAALAAVAPR